MLKLCSKLTLKNDDKILLRNRAYYMFSWCKYLSVILVFFPPLGLWSGNFFMIAPFPNRFLLVPLSIILNLYNNNYEV